MILPGHLAASYLATKLLLNLTNAKFSSTETTTLYVISMIASVAPDLDLFKFFFEHSSLKLQKTDSHRKYVSHAPALWLFGCLFIVLIGYITSNPFVSYVGWAILVGSWSHFLGDSIEYGIMWLWPISKKFYCIHPVPEEEIDSQKGTLGYYWVFFRDYYIKRWTFYLEITLIALALWFVMISP